MTLKVREGWKTYKANDCTYLCPPEEGLGNLAYYVDMDPGGQSIWAYPNGGHESVGFDTIEDAHKYLIKEGSESPWEEV
jgi:hypothetical protein